MKIRKLRKLFTRKYEYNSSTEQNLREALDGMYKLRNNRLIKRNKSVNFRAYLFGETKRRKNTVLTQILR